MSTESIKKRHPKHGKKCWACGHMIYWATKLQSYRCGPGCDKCKDETSKYLQK